MGHTKNNAQYMVAILLVTLIAAPSFFYRSAFAQTGNGLVPGNYIDGVDFYCYNDEELANKLISGDLDIIASPISGEYFGLLNGSDNIEAILNPGRDFHLLMFNCSKYPYNITSFRRAVAYQIDKYVLAGQFPEYAMRPIDSLIPEYSGFSIEGSLPYDYRGRNTTLAKSLLDDAGFLDSNSDDVRESPDGSPLTIQLYYYNTTFHTQEAMAMDIRQALTDLNLSVSIHSYSNSTEELLYSINYDCALIWFYDYSRSMDWYLFSSSFSNTASFIWFLKRFGNDSYSNAISRFVSASSTSAIADACADLQRNINSECQCIPLLESNGVVAYRTIRFNFRNFSDVIDGASFWSLFTALSTSGAYGGYVRAGINVMSSINPLVLYEIAFNIPWMLSMCDSLFRYTPNGDLIPWLVQSYYSKVFENDSSILKGHIRYVFTLYQNLTKNNGQPFNTTEIVNSIEYCRVLGHPLYYSNNFIYDVDVIDDFTFEVEFSNESIWLFRDFVTSFNLFTSYVLSNITLDWSSWNPEPGTVDESFIVSGPFAIHSYNPSAIGAPCIQLRVNPHYFRGLDRPMPTSTTTQTSKTTETSTTQTTETSTTETSTSPSTQTGTTTTSGDSNNPSTPNSDSLGLLGTPLGAFVTIVSMLIIVFFTRKIIILRRENNTT